MTESLQSSLGNWDMNIPFPFGTYTTANPNLKQGQFVKMTSNSNTVAAVSAGTDFPIGIVAVAPDKNNQLTVAHTSIIGTVTAVGTGVTVGALVTSTGLVDDYANFVPATSGNYATGVVLATQGNYGTANTFYKIGLLHTPLKIA
jgi:hypothetical protein